MKTACVLMLLILIMFTDVSEAQFSAIKATVRNQEVSAKLAEAQRVLDEGKTAKTLALKDVTLYQHKINVIRTRAVSKERRGMRPQEAEELSKLLDILIIEIKVSVTPPGDD
ncbi:MAG: hypothetical protein H7844_04330 [Nitrospirae bacterium YQR-1]